MTSCLDFTAKAQQGARAGDETNAGREATRELKTKEAKQETDTCGRISYQRALRSVS